MLVRSFKLPQDDFFCLCLCVGFVFPQMFLKFSPLMFLCFYKLPKQPLLPSQDPASGPTTEDKCSKQL